MIDFNNIMRYISTVLTSNDLKKYDIGFALGNSHIEIYYSKETHKINLEKEVDERLKNYKKDYNIKHIVTGFNLD